MTDVFLILLGLTLCVIAREVLLWLDRWWFKRQMKKERTVVFQRRDGKNY
jgi:hypothetical protein